MMNCSTCCYLNFIDIEAEVDVDLDVLVQDSMAAVYWVSLLQMEWFVQQPTIIALAFSIALAAFLVHCDGALLHTIKQNHRGEYQV